MSLLPLRPERVTAVVVTFHPDPPAADRLRRIAAQVGRVVVVDNGSADAEVARLLAAGGGAGVEVIRNERNRGVAAALNQGAEAGLAAGAGWLLFLDQDTVPDPGMVDVLGEALEAVPEPERLAVLGANYREGRGGPTRLERDRVVPEEAAVRRPTVITAGSLVPAAVWRELGGFREELFVDHVDDDFCLRARARGYGVWMTREPAMTHTIGAQSRHRLPWRETATSNHGPLRRYYQTRNHAVLLAEHGAREPGWAVRTLRSRTKALLLMLLFEDGRARKLREMLRGLGHAALGRLGPHPRQPGGPS